MQDDQAIALLKTGDLSGLEPLISRYSLRALRTAVLIVQDEEIAEDIVQAAFVQAANKIKQLKSDCFWGWFLKIVIHNAIKTARKQSKWISIDGTQNLSVETLEEWLIDQRPLPEDQVITAEFQNAIWNALAKLKPEVRAVVIMKYYLGMSESEITQDVGNPLSTIKWRLYSARRTLRSMLAVITNDQTFPCQEEFKDEND